MLLGKGADVNVQNGRALREAFKNGHMEVMRLLLEKGANINAEIIGTYVLPLVAVMLRNYEEEMLFLLNRFADVNSQCVRALLNEFRNYYEVVMKPHGDVISLVRDIYETVQDISVDDDEVMEQFLPLRKEMRPFWWGEGKEEEETLDEEEIYGDDNDDEVDSSEEYS